MKKPLISIGILNWNGLQYIKKTIPKIKGLIYESKEIIIFDNGSDDGSYEYLLKEKNIKLIRSNFNIGYSKAKNIIIKKAKGKYILLLDDDILIRDKDCLEKLMKFFLDNNPGFISVLLANADENKTSYFGGYWNIFGYSFRKKISLDYFLQCKEDFHYSHSPEGGAIFFEKEHFLDIGYFDETQPYYCDVGDIGLRSYILTGKKNLVTHKVYFIHLGIKRKKDLSRWLFNLEYIITGTFKILFYNFTKWNVLRYFPLLIISFFLGTLYKCLEYRSFLPFLIYFKSVFLFFKEIPDILKKRKDIQSKRIIKNDDFLNIKISKFE